MTQRGSSGGGGPGSGSGNRSELTADQAGSGPEQGAAGDGARGDGGTGEDGAGNGPGPGEGEGESSAPTPEHLREASNLILKNLQERLERGDVDEELLREFGWKDLGAMEKFVSKLEEQLEAANDDSPEARARQREFEELLKNLALSGETRGAFGTVDAVGTDLSVLARVDLDRLQQQVEPQLLGVYLQLQTQQPAATATFPAVVPPPPPDEGPHRSYAGQWAIFAVIWVFGYPTLVRRTALRRAQDASEA